MVKKTLKDIILTKADAERAYKSARKWVKNNLKDPDSAKFDDDKFGAFKEMELLKCQELLEQKIVLMPSFPQNGMLRWTHLRIMCSTHL